MVNGLYISPIPDSINAFLRIRLQGRKILGCSGRRNADKKIQDFHLSSTLGIIVQELAIKKRHQAYRIAAIVHIARLKPKS